MASTDTHIVSQNTTYTKNNTYHGVFSPHTRSTPKYYADKNSNSGRVLDKETGDYFVSALSGSYSEIRLLPIDGAITANTPTWANEAHKKVNSFIGFFATQITEQSREKYEVIPLIGDDFAAFFYGANPREISINGIVFNTIEDNWRDGFDILYRNYVRGSATANTQTIAQVKYGDRVITGYIVELMTAMDASNPLVADFNIKLIVRDVAYTSVKNQDEILRQYSFQTKISDVNSQTKFKYLDSKRLNEIRDFTRTGTIVPAPRPPAPRKSLGAAINSKNCILQTNQEGDVTGAFSGGIADTTCTSADIVRTALTDLQNAVTSKEKYLKELETKGKIPPGDTTLESYNQKINELSQKLNNYKDKQSSEGKFIKEKFEREAAAALENTTEAATGKEVGIVINGVEVGKAKADTSKPGVAIVAEDASEVLVNSVGRSSDKDKNQKSKDEIDALIKEQENRENTLKTKSDNAEKERVKRELKKQVKAVSYPVLSPTP